MNRVLKRALASFLVTAGLLCLGIYVEGQLSGWSRLAEEYPGEAERRGLQITVQEGGLGNPRWFHRVAPLHAAMGLGGLRLSYPFPYSLGHPPLEIPWSRLRVVEADMGENGTSLLLSVSGAEERRISLRGELATVVREWLGAGGSER